MIEGRVSGWLLAFSLVCGAGGCSCEPGNPGTGGGAANGGSEPAGAGTTSFGDGGGGSTSTFGTGGAGGMNTNVCKVSESDLDTPPPCRLKAPADSFDPVVQWQWSPATPGGTFSGSLTTPLVGNFTDDNGDGAIDLCDVPDVVIEAFTSETSVAGEPVTYAGRIFILSGDTGALITQSAQAVDANINPAFGDLDGDGVPEIVAATTLQQVIAFAADGSVKFVGDAGTWPDIDTFNSVNLGAYCHAFAIYDLDADGSPEILGGFDVFDSTGNLLWTAPGNLNSIPGEPFWCPTPTAADLDGDGRLEVIYGHAAYHDDGSLYWQVSPALNPGHPHVANLDSDPEPEVLVNTDAGISVIEHNGAVKFGPLRPNGEAVSARCWGKPGVIHDFDGDGDADLATGTCQTYTVYDVGASLTGKWTQPISDVSGLATGTAFDFLGDGIAEAIYADELNAYVFDGATGAPELSVPRQSGTLVEYPVVADVDNDESAEIIVVSNAPGAGLTGAVVTVYRDSQDRWIPARRVWNQHAYHVTNVREDGTVPQNMKKSWQLLNTFRTNSQVEAGGDCDPDPPR
jgi:hypothetical protein